MSCRMVAPPDNCEKTLPPNARGSPAAAHFRAAVGCMPRVGPRTTWAELAWRPIPRAPHRLRVEKTSTGGQHDPRGGVLPLAEWFVSGRSHNPCAELLRVVEMPVDVLNAYVHVLVNLVRTRGAKLAALPAQHNGALSDRELCVTDRAAWSHGTQALGESES